MRMMVFCAALVGLTGCGAVKEAAQVTRQANTEARGDAKGRAFFAGPVSVVADRHGEITAFTLRSCGVNRVCLEGWQHRTGQAHRDGQATVVEGIHPGHVYHLMPGGSGFVRVHDGTEAPLVWD